MYHGPCEARQTAPPAPTPPPPGAGYDLLAGLSGVFGDADGGWAAAGARQGMTNAVLGTYAPAARLGAYD